MGASDAKKHYDRKAKNRAVGIMRASEEKEQVNEMKQNPGFKKGAPEIKKIAGMQIAKDYKSTLNMLAAKMEMMAKNPNVLQASGIMGDINSYYSTLSRSTDVKELVDAALKKVGLMESAEEIQEAQGPCWDGYEKVPGKDDYEDGSCKLKEGIQDKKAVAAVKAMLDGMSKEDAIRKYGVSPKKLDQVKKELFEGQEPVELEESPMKMKVRDFKNLVADMIQEADDKQLYKIARILGKSVYFQGSGVVVEDVWYEEEVSLKLVEKVIDYFWTNCMYEAYEQFDEEEVAEVIGEGTLDRKVIKQLKAMDQDEAMLIIQGLPKNMQKQAKKELGIKEKVDGRTKGFKETAKRLADKKEQMKERDELEESSAAMKTLMQRIKKANPRHMSAEVENVERAFEKGAITRDELDKINAMLPSSHKIQEAQPGKGTEGGYALTGKTGYKGKYGKDGGAAGGGAGAGAVSASNMDPTDDPEDDDKKTVTEAGYMDPPATKKEIKQKGLYTNHATIIKDPKQMKRKNHMHDTDQPRDSQVDARRQALRKDTAFGDANDGLDPTTEDKDISISGADFYAEYLSMVNKTTIQENLQTAVHKIKKAVKGNKDIDDAIEDALGSLTPAEMKEIVKNKDRYEKMFTDKHAGYIYHAISQVQG